MKVNYHTHTAYCGHASGYALDYVKEAYNQGFTLLGISDHAPHDLLTDPNVRMKEAIFPQYLKDIEEAQAQYIGKLTILKGIEVEYFDHHKEYYKNLRKHLDYMIHGQHYISFTNQLDDLISGFALGTKEEIYLYETYMKKAIQSGYFDIFAHPDLYMYGYKKWDDHAKKVAHSICQEAKQYDAVFEYNANGYRRGKMTSEIGITPKYPRTEFWMVVKEYGIKTIINSDCHQPSFLYDATIKEAEQVYQSLGLNMIQEIKLKGVE
jgi:histidinol-phosphatase (PHP family)